jgi:LacI family transcriptional regulator
MAKRIDEAIADLGYRPNVMARRLSRGASEIIGFVTSALSRELELAARKPETLARAQAAVAARHV